MKILYTAFDRFPAPKGAAVRIEQMLRILSQFADVQAVLLGDQGLSEYEKISENLTIHRLTQPEDSFLSRSVRFAEYVLEQLIQWQPDVVQFRSLWDAYPLSQYVRNKTPRPRLLYELHGLPEYELAFHFPDLPESLLAKIHQQQALVLQAVDGIICPSQIHLDYLHTQGVDPEKTGLVFNGVDPDLFLQRPAPNNEIPLILYIGTLAPWQGLETLLEALQWVESPFRLQIVGSGQRRWQQDLLTRAFQLKLSHAVAIMDPIPHEMMPDLIQTADLCVAPLDASERNVMQGCMPLKILEYMAMGKAILASDLAVTRSLLEHNQSGYLFPAENTEVLQQALNVLLSKPELRQRLGAAAQKRVLNQFTWEQSEQQVHRFYEQILGCTF